MNGILWIDKPQNMTSRDVVNKISQIYKTKKVGHTGTLDPSATGVLIICLGKYTKLVDRLTSKEKEYIATMKLGIETDTLDITGNIIKQQEVKFTKEEIEFSFQNFPKSYMQTVPAYSAVKLNGKKLYEYARANIEVPLPKKMVEIKELELLKIEEDTITFRALVSKGTYIRSLIKDIASTLHTCATMSSLRRTKQGSVKIEDCLSLDNITNLTPLKTMEDIFRYPKREVSKEELKKIENGNILHLESDEKTLMLTYQNIPVAIYEKDNLEYKMIFKVI